MASFTGSFDLRRYLPSARHRPRDARRRLPRTLLATTCSTIVAFVAARSLLVVSPNRGSRDYGIYVSLTLATLLIAIVLENECCRPAAPTLHYVIVPQLAAAAGLAPVDLVPPGAVARDARRCRNDGDDRRRRACSGVGTQLARSVLLVDAARARRAARYSCGSRPISTQRAVREGELDLHRLEGNARRARRRRRSPGSACRNGLR